MGKVALFCSLGTYLSSDTLRTINTRDLEAPAHMITEDILGVLCTVGTGFLYVPQIVTTVRVRSITGLSLNHLLYSVVICFLWLAYGFMRDDIAIIVSQISLGVQLLILCIMYAYLRNSENSNSV